MIQKIIFLYDSNKTLSKKTKQKVGMLQSIAMLINIHNLQALNTCKRYVLRSNGIDIISNWLHYQGRGGGEGISNSKVPHYQPSQDTPGLAPEGGGEELVVVVENGIERRGGEGERRRGMI